MCFIVRVISSLRLNDYVRAHRACLHGGGGWSPYLSCKPDQMTVKMRDYMERQVTPPKQVTSPTWGLLLPCKQALRHDFLFAYRKCEVHFVFKKLSP